jgi:mannose-6-phosphate isomerase
MGGQWVRYSFWAAILVTLAFALSPRPPQLPGQPDDKVQHILAFLVLTSLAVAAYPRTSLPRLFFWLSGFGGLIELLQAIPLLHRDSSMMDWAADSASVAAVLFLAHLARGRWSGGSAAANEVASAKENRPVPLPLVARPLEKPWGRRRLPAPFDGFENGEPIGEIWFDAPGREPELLIKYLFTSERLSVQVHPDDEAAREKGHKRGKDEAWLVLDADPEGTIGVGLKERLSSDALRQAALSGEIEDLLDWRAVKRGDVLFSPAGTIHAIGAGVAIVEIQQNVDVTYRLYDYGRDRGLHLDEAVPVARAEPYTPPVRNIAGAPAGRQLLASGGHFVLESWSGEGTLHLGATAGDPLFLICVEGSAAAAGERLEKGSVWLVEGDCAVEAEADALLLLAYCGPEPRAALA